MRDDPSSHSRIACFARNQYDHHALKALLQKLGVTLRAVAQPIDDSVTGKLMDGILAAFSEFDDNLRRERCVTGMQAAASRGRWVFPPPLGRAKDPDFPLRRFVRCHTCARPISGA